ncbi:MAG: hypothetical protein ACPG77_03800, partial [Nannocystaceae bacterium]
MFRLSSTLTVLPLLALLVMPGCGTPAGDSDTDSGETDSATDSDTDTTGTDGNAYDLGDHASAACVDAMQQLPAFIAATTAVTEASADASSVDAAYSGTALQTFVQQLDSENMRSDDAGITAAIAGATASDLVDAEALVLHALVEGLRSRVAAPEGGVTDPFAAWDDANCIWEGAFRGPAADAESWGTDYSDDIVSVVDNAFLDGHAGISGEPEAAAIDDWVTPPNKQRIEKNHYRIIHRHVAHYATVARDNADALAARRALGWFNMF